MDNAIHTLDHSNIEGWYLNKYTRPDEFTLENIINIRKKKSDKTSDVIKYHKTRILDKILTSYKDHLGYCHYTIDDFVAKFPPYNPTDIAKSVCDQLYTEFEETLGFEEITGFNCKVLYKNSLYFEWKPKAKSSEHVDEIIKMVKNRIETAASNGKDTLFYEVPVSLMRFAWYDPSDVAILVSRQLASLGFVVKVLKSLIYISWNITDVKKKSNINVDYKTKEERKTEALDKMQYINERRYVEFVNPKKYNNKYN